MHALALTRYLLEDDIGSAVDDPDAINPQTQISQIPNEALRAFTEAFEKFGWRGTWASPDGEREYVKSTRDGAVRITAYVYYWNGSLIANGKVETHNREFDVDYHGPLYLTPEEFAEDLDHDFSSAGDLYYEYETPDPHDEWRGRREESSIQRMIRQFLPGKFYC